MKSGSQDGDWLVEGFTRRHGFVPVFGSPLLGDEFDNWELVAVFEHLVNIWFVKPVNLLNKAIESDPDYGFTLLATVNSIPELLGKIQGHKKRQYSEGLKYIFGILVDDDTCDFAHKKLRSSIAHSFLTRDGIVLNHGSSPPIRPSPDKMYLEINPKLFAKACVCALERYVRELRTALDSDMSEKRELFDSFRVYMTEDKKGYVCVKTCNTTIGFQDRIMNYEEFDKKVKLWKRQKRCHCRPDIVVASPADLYALYKRILSKKE